MNLDLEPPIYILPAFSTLGIHHAELAKKLGLKIGPLARPRRGNNPEHFLVQVPDQWTETHDQFGQYLVKNNCRRIRFGNLNSNFYSESELLTRFSMQEWWLGGDWMVYVRKIVGGEDNIYQYGKCHHIAETEIQLKPAVHHSREGSPGFVSCEEWLKEHYPDWKNPLAYWDEE